MQVRLLGSLHVAADGQSVDLSTRAEQLLLAQLALTPGQAQPRAKLAGLLWPDSEEAQARSNLRHTLWRLKKAIGDEVLETEKETIALRSEALTIDVRQFLDGAAGLETPEALIGSLEHYGGELLPGFYEDWVVRERERLAAAYERRVARLLVLLLAEGRYEEMKRWADRRLPALRRGAGRGARR